MPAEFRDAAMGRDALSASEWSGEGISDLAGLRGEETAVLREKASSLFADGALFGAGLRREWDRLAGPGAAPEDAFRESYASYVTEGTALRRESPERYEFLRDHVFYGVEYRRPADFSEQVAEGVAALRSMEALRPEVWEGLSVGERAAALREVEARLAASSGRPAVPLVVDETAQGTNGYFDTGTGVMHVSRGLLADGRELLSAVEVVAHEGRHAYQKHAVETPDFHPDAAQTAAWAENTRTYLTAELYGYEAYRNQPVEADAWAFGEQVRDGLYGGRRA